MVLNVRRGSILISFLNQLFHYHLLNNASHLDCDASVTTDYILIKLEETRNTSPHVTQRSRKEAPQHRPPTHTACMSLRTDSGITFSLSTWLTALPLKSSFSTFNWLSLVSLRSSPHIYLRWKRRLNHTITNCTPKLKKNIKKFWSQTVLQGTSGQWENRGGLWILFSCLANELCRTM